MKALKASGKGNKDPEVVAAVAVLKELKAAGGGQSKPAAAAKPVEDAGLSKGEAKKAAKKAEAAAKKAAYKAGTDPASGAAKAPATAAAAPSGLSRMSPQEVGAFLVGVTLAQYAGSFLAKKVDGHALVAADDARLKEYGMKFAPHRRKLLCILKSEGSFASHPLAVTAKGAIENGMRLVRNHRQPSNEIPAPIGLGLGLGLQTPTKAGKTGGKKRVSVGAPGETPKVVRQISAKGQQKRVPGKQQKLPATTAAVDDWRNGIPACTGIKRLQLLSGQTAPAESLFSVEILPPPNVRGKWAVRITGNASGGSSDRPFNPMIRARFYITVGMRVVAKRAGSWEAAMVVAGPDAVPGTWLLEAVDKSWKDRVAHTDIGPGKYSTAATPTQAAEPAATTGGSETKETMTAKVKAKGAEIAALKKEKGPKDAGIKPLLDELSALKAKYAEVAGEPWPVSAQQQKKSKKKEQKQVRSNAGTQILS